MDKAELRKIYLAEQKTLSPTERKQKSLQIADLFFQNFDVRKISFLHCFLPIERFNEIDTRLILERIWKEFPHIETIVPRVNLQTNEIESLRFTPETKLAQSNWQIHEPEHDETIETEKIVLVLVPLLCFDARGFRVGYGKGFYDKFLAKCRADCIKIGLSYYAPVSEISDVRDFDVKLDFFITPKTIFNYKRQTILD